MTFSGGGALAQQLAAALTPAVLSIVGQIGSDCTVYRPLYSKRADNSTQLHLPPHQVEQRMALSKISAARAQKTWGVERLVTGEAIVPSAVDLEEKDIIVVTAGPYTGEKFLVEHKLTQPEAGVSFVGLGPYKGAVGTWLDHPNIALAAFADEQDTGSQIIVSHTGPNGWLGRFNTADQDDPTYASNPTRWHMDGVGATGYRPMVSFGDVLDAEAFNHPSGFTLAAIGDFRDALVADTFTSIINKDRDYQDSANNGVWFLALQSRLSLYVAFDGSEVSVNGDQAGTDLDAVAPGPHVVGAHYDRAAVRGSRVGFWVGGASVAAAFEQLNGAEGEIETSPTHLTLCGNHGSGIRSLESGAAIAIARGVMTAGWHADLYRDMVARGWA